MARKTKEELEAIKKKYSVQDIFSWSRYNCYKNSSYEYLLRYIKREKQTRDNIYGILGNSAHDILQDLYEGKVKYEDMIDVYNADFMNAEMAGLKFDRSDDEKNEKISEKYLACMRHFFKNHKVIPHKLVLEEYLIIKVGKYIFGGYFDALYKDDEGYYNIIDWKTSTIYSGKKIDELKGQLVLYAEGLVQKGIEVDKIKISWNFMKYLNVTMPLKNGKARTSRAERHNWFSKIKNNAKMWLKDLDKYTDDEIEDMLDYSLEFNTIDNLPQEIQDLYTIEDCYVYADFNQEEIDKLKEELISTLTEIEEKTEEYNKTKDHKVFWEEITDKESYYFANLCGYNAHQHLPYKEYLDQLELGVKDEYKTDKGEESSDSWMQELGLV